MIDLATHILCGFQTTLDSAFGNDLGWVFGHLILVSALIASILAIRERDHIIAHSGIDKQFALDIAVLLLLTLTLFWLSTAVFGFASGASVGLSFASALCLRWMINVMG
ncbi:MAG TPA: hypothetical protein QF703_00400 [Candidatus Thalassarchaeaceae archaeon]|nr:hypothetical protein [Candidatus Thalassarchaeaceae archaeon]